MKCKKCGKEFTNGYPGKGLCFKCYQHQYITEKWKNNPEFRLAQKKRTYKWMEEHPEEWKEINKRALIKFYTKQK